jgi:hypothetical protein
MKPLCPIHNMMMELTQTNEREKVYRCSKCGINCTTIERSLFSKKENTE